MSESIDDEIVSINAIFDEGTLIASEGDGKLTYLRLPFLPSIVLRVEFPIDYPDAPPSILGTESVGHDLPKGAGSEIVDLARHVLARVYNPGEACLYDLLEELREDSDIAQFQKSSEAPHDSQDHAGSRRGLDRSIWKDDNAELGPEPPWVIADPLTEKKSVFVARAAPVSSPEQAEKYITHLLATDKKVARASHNITSWRIRGPNGTSFQDCNDDGETAAGSRMLHLMQLLDVWDVMVVVTRWYGGVHLGPDRFRLINNATREALVLGGFAKDGKSDDSKKKTKK